MILLTGVCLHKPISNKPLVKAEGWIVFYFGISFPTHKQLLEPCPLHEQKLQQATPGFDVSAKRKNYV